MARNGSGTYSLPSGQPVVTGTTISSTTFNTLTADIATALTQSIAADGQTPITANIPMNSKKLTGLAAGTTSGDALSFGQSSAALTSPVLTTPSSSGGTFTDPTLAGSTSGTVKLSATGVPYGSALHNNAGAVTGATNQYMCSGTYTPTGTAVVNVDAVVPAKAIWMRVGNVVTVSGRVSIDATSAATTTTSIALSLPIASNLAGATDLSGVMNLSGGISPVNVGGSVFADTVNDRAGLTYTNNGSTAAVDWYYTYQYEIL